MSNQHNYDNDAIVSLAISTAFLRSGFYQESTPGDVEEEQLWDQIEGMTKVYLSEVSDHLSTIQIDRYRIALAIWGIEKNELDDILRS